MRQHLRLPDTTYRDITLAQTATPTLGGGETGTVTFTATSGTSGTDKSSVGDVFTFTAPDGFTIASAMSGVSSAYWTCTLNSTTQTTCTGTVNSPWTSGRVRTFSVNVTAGDSVTAGSHTGTVVYNAATTSDGDTSNNSLSYTIKTYRDIVPAQTATPTLGGGETGTASVTMTASTSGTNKSMAGDTGTFTAPDGFTITAISGPASSYGTCTVTSDTKASCTWNTSDAPIWYNGTTRTLSITLKADSSVTAGTRAGTFVYAPGTYADADLSNNTIEFTVNTYRDITLAQSATPTLGGGETGTVSVTTTASTAGTNKASTGDIFTFNAPDGFTFTGAMTGVDSTYWTCTLVSDTKTTCTAKTDTTWTSGRTRTLSVVVKAGRSVAAGTHTGTFVYDPATYSDADTTNNEISYTVNTYRDLSFEQTVTPSIAPGETGTMSVRITSSTAGTNKPAAGDSFTMTAPDGFTFTAAPAAWADDVTCTLDSSTRVTCAYSSSSSSIWASSTTATMSATVKAGSSYSAGTYTKSGGFVYTPGTYADADLSDNTIDLTGIITDASADIKIEKTAPADITPGEAFDYTLTVTNNGPSDATGVVATDALPDGLTFTSSSGCTASGQDVTCDIGTMTASAVKTLTIKATPSSSLTDGATVSNTAKVTSTSTDPESSNDTSTASSTVAASADIKIEKSAPADITPGAAFDYTLTVTNNGPSDATGVVATDTLPDSVTFASSSDCTASGQAVTCTVGAMTASEVKTLTIKVTPAATLTEGSSVINTATVTSTSTDPGTSNDTATASSTVAGASADIKIDKTAPAYITPGEAFDYTLTVTNNGPSDATGVVATDRLPDSVTFASSSDCTTSGQDVTCDVGAMTASEVKTLTIKVRPKSSLTQGETVKNTATVTSTSTDPDTSNDTASASSTVAAAAADIKIEKTAPADVTPGKAFDYTLAVTNNGPSDATGVVVTDDLPDGLTFVSSDDCTASGQAVSCDVGAMTAEEVKTITVKVTPSASLSEGATIKNTATVTSITTDPDHSNKSASASSTVGAASADIKLTKSAPSEITPGESFDYSLTVTNNGPSDATGVSVNDTLPDGLTFKSADDCTGSGQAVTCEVGAMTAAEVKTITVRVTAASSLTKGSTIENTATVTSASTDPDDSNNTASATSTVGAPSTDVELVKSAPPTITPGEAFD